MKELVWALVCGALCVTLASALVTERQQGLARDRHIAVLEEQVTSLFLAARWDVPSPFLASSDEALAGGSDVPVIRPKTLKPAWMRERQQ